MSPWKPGTPAGVATAGVPARAGFPLWSQPKINVFKKSTKNGENLTEDILIVTHSASLFNTKNPFPCNTQSPLSMQHSKPTYYAALTAHFPCNVQSPALREGANEFSDIFIKVKVVVAWFVRLTKCQLLIFAPVRAITTIITTTVLSIRLSWLVSRLYNFIRGAEQTTAERFLNHSPTSRHASAT